MASSPSECWSDMQTVCIRLAPKSSRKCDRLVGGRWRLRYTAKRKVTAACVGEHLLRVLARHANSLHPPLTKEQPQACSIGRRFLMAPVHSKEEGGGSLCWRATPSSAGTKCTQFASVSHRRPSLLNWSEVADGSGAKQRGRRRQPVLASSRCEWGCSSVRGTFKLFACLAGTRWGCSLAEAAAAFLFALHQSRQKPPTNRAGLRLLFGTRRMQTVCISCRHSQGLLANSGCRHLPLCFAPELAATTDQSSRLVAALRCEADAECLPVWPALAGAACQQRLPRPSSLLCTGAVRDHRPI